ncbi:hypothetical protein [Roseinatronobacter thiooxidans]|uniref:hypothetical protein n=1 Tax=Roseinatronobacter thiooxidans TaxID=121821 RepID=UPI0008F8EE39|nr:hypothetical protein [Roseinatronobacter thiooxidans]
MQAYSMMKCFLTSGVNHLAPERNQPQRFDCRIEFRDQVGGHRRQRQTQLALNLQARKFPETLPDEKF